MDDTRSTSPATAGAAELLRSVSSSSNPSKKKTKSKKSTTTAGSSKTSTNKSGVAAAMNTSTATKKSAANQQYVDHTYTDYAIVEEDDLRLLDENSSLLPVPSSSGEATAREKLKGMSCTYGPMKKNAGGVVQPFPGKLLEVLDRSDLGDIIDWMSHGRAFIVKKPKLFTTNVLPRFFKQTKFLSFTRQLNLWGFKRITRGVDAGAYYHELFLRGRPYLAMRMRRQKIKGTGMKLTPNPDAEPDFYSDWPVLPPLNARRVLPPLPPLPAERLGLQQAGVGVAMPGGAMMLNSLQQQAVGAPGPGGLMDKKQQAGVSTMDSVSENMLNALKYGASAGRGPADNMSSLLRQKEMQDMSCNTFPSFGATNQMHQFGQGPGGMPNGMPNRMPNPQAMPPMPSVHPGQRVAGTNPGNYDDLLLAPGVSPFDNASRSRYLEQQQSMNASTSGPAPPTNDPIHDELSAIIRNRSQQAVNAAAMSIGMYPPQQLSSDHLLMERLRDLDRAQQIKREQQDNMSMLHHARLYDDLAASSAAGAGGPPAPPRVSHPPPHPPHANGPMPTNPGLGQGGAFDRFSYPPPQPPPPSMQPPLQQTPLGSVGTTASAGKDSFASRYGNDHNPVESSVKDALREANHLEELALAQRAKARSLALAGALQSRFGGVGGAPMGGVPLSPSNNMEQQLPGDAKAGTSPPSGAQHPLNNDSGTIGDNCASFGRPFGRKD